MKRILAILAIFIGGVLASACVPPANTPFGGGAINPFFPLDVGHTWDYAGVDEGRATTEHVVVTGDPSQCRRRSDVQALPSRIYS